MIILKTPGARILISAQWVKELDVDTTCIQIIHISVLYVKFVKTYNSKLIYVQWYIQNH